MKFGTYNDLIAFAFEKFQAPTAKEIEKFLTFVTSHSYEEVLPQNFNLDIKPSTITTKAPSATKYEAHKKMWDLQLIFSGKEAIGILPLKNIGSPTTDYEETADIEFYGTVEKLGGDFVTLQQGNGIFLAPCDAHAPCLTADNIDTHNKIVVKIPVENEI